MCDVFSRNDALRLANKVAANMCEWLRQETPGLKLLPWRFSNMMMLKNILSVMMLQNDKEARPFRIYVFFYMDPLPTYILGVGEPSILTASGVPVVTPLAVNG